MSNTTLLKSKEIDKMFKPNCNYSNSFTNEEMETMKNCIQKILDIVQKSGDISKMGLFLKEQESREIEENALTVLKGLTDEKSDLNW